MTYKYAISHFLQVTGQCVGDSHWVCFLLIELCPSLHPYPTFTPFSLQTFRFKMASNITTLPVSAVFGWKTVFLQDTNCSCLFREARSGLDNIMCFSPFPVTETLSTIAATSNIPRVAVKYTCYTTWFGVKNEHKLIVTQNHSTFHMSAYI